MMQVTMQPVSPAQLHDIWGVVRSEMEVAASHSLGEWIPEDCYSGIQQGVLSLFLWIVDSRYAGFIVLQKKQLFSGPVLHIFALYVIDEYGEYIDANMTQVDAIATKIGAKKITFQSPRRGWERRCKSLGFEAKSINYEREV